MPFVKSHTLCTTSLCCACPALRHRCNYASAAPTSRFPLNELQPRPRAARYVRRRRTHCRITIITTLYEVFFFPPSHGRPLIICVFSYFYNLRGAHALTHARARRRRVPRHTTSSPRGRNTTAVRAVVSSLRSDDVPMFFVLRYQYRRCCCCCCCRRTDFITIIINNIFYPIV